MSYLSLLIAWFLMRASELNGAPLWDAYLDQLVKVEAFFNGISWGILILYLLLSIASIILVKKSRQNSTRRWPVKMMVGCGCISFFFLLLPLWELITLNLAKDMAASVGPTGVINMGKLIISAILYMVLGIG